MTTFLKKSHIRSVSVWIFTIILMCISTGIAYAETPLQTDIPQENKNQQGMTIAASIQAESMTIKDIKRYLSGQNPSWPNDVPVTIVLYPRLSFELRWLCRNIIKIPPGTYRRFLMQKAFRSGINIIEVKNQEEAAKVLQETPGAIAPIGINLLSETIQEVKQK